jgi:hypothetical protein
MQYSVVGSDEGSTVTVVVKGQKPFVATDSHPNFDRIVEAARKGDETVVELFDVAVSATTKFERLTERVTTANGKLYFDSEEVDNALATQVVRFLKDGIEDWEPLVLFFENVQQNPNEHSREQLFAWLDARNFTLTREGHVVAYKGVAATDKESVFQSISSGTAIVDGETHTGHIPNYVGAIVEMPRNEVAHDPSAACSTGLHVGTYDYAKQWAQGTLLEVHVNPRDVVSVPTNDHGDKVRVCRYKVVGTEAVEYVAAVLDYDDTDDSPEDDVVEIPVDDLEDENDSGVKVGQVYENTDARCKGVSFKVEFIEGDHAVGKSLPSNLTRKVRLDRLTSRKYRLA